MIYQLRTNLIRISCLSLIVVFFLVYGIICFFSFRELDSGVDSIVNILSQYDGEFPEDYTVEDIQREFHGTIFTPNFVNERTVSGTRHFTIWIDADNQKIKENLDADSSVTEEKISEYLATIMGKNRKRGWIENYRYRICGAGNGSMLVFVDGTMYRMMLRNLLIMIASVFITITCIILLLIICLSKRTVEPIAESYEKQKQFITDANHELKTPLTLILTNLDIAEAELGKNEWLEDIKSESERMSALVNRLVMLTRMDEESNQLETATFSLSEMMSNAAAEFRLLADERQKYLECSIEPDISYCGNEEAIQHVLSILLDNALKYCDENGRIVMSLRRKRHIVIQVENTFRAVEQTELNRLFDRFYRTDKARTFNEGFGIGLSIAKAIVEKHHGEISSYKKDKTNIGFRIILK
ncbi:MAG: HAMP domain-containing histidine kinase [Clostridia bacterium]|nr:HAMP domain-containing histidine kinase [Clostridia bacterium]